MKLSELKKAAVTGLSLLVLFVSAKTMFCQQTEPSTQSDEARRAALVTALERAQDEVKAGRKYVDALKGQIATTQGQVDKLQARVAAGEQTAATLRAEIENKTATIDSLKARLQVKEGEVIVLTANIDQIKRELAKTKKKLTHAHLREKIFGTAAAVLLVLLFL